MLALSAAVILQTSCSKKPKRDFVQNNITFRTDIPEHDAMVQYLAEANQKYFLNPENRFASATRAEWLEKQAPPEKQDKKVLHHKETGFHWLAAGETEKAIAHFETAIQMMEQGNQSGEVLNELQMLLAISYLRLGEQKNCIANHVRESCILPVAEAAWYTVREATDKAANLFEEILKSNPENLNAAFLLNVARMNLGQYPDAVPEQFRIREDRLKSEYEFPRFMNLAIDLDVDVLSTSGGVCADDFNNDGFIDIINTGWLLTDQIKYFVNNGDGTFTDQTEAANLKGITGGLHVIHADYNNDGFKDIFIPRGAWWNDYGKLPNSLLKNNGDGTFTDVTYSSGLFSLYPTQTAVFADFDNNGWLDIFIGNETRRDSEKYPCELFMSNGDGTFTNQAKTAGAALEVFAKGVAAGDYDNDGFIDIVISSQGQDNFLLHNETGKNKGKVAFKEVAKEAGVSGPVKSFPVTFLDYNNDGWLDIFIATYDANNCDYDNAADFLGKQPKGEYSVLYKNNGNGTFSNLVGNSGLERSMTAMGLNYGDIDNDGWLDLYVGTGTPEYTSLVPNKMFRNNLGNRFQDVTTAGGFGHLQKGHGIGFADFDEDGDQDIVEDMGGGYMGDPFQSAFFENPGSPNAWVTLRLIGNQSNKDAIGSRVIITTMNAEGKNEVFHHVISNGGSFGSNSLQLEAGLGSAQSIISVEVIWAGTLEKQSWENLPVRKIIALTEGQSEIQITEPRPFIFKRADLTGTHTMDHQM